MLAFLTYQTDKIKVVEHDGEASTGFTVTLKEGPDGWQRPTLSMSVLSWALTQVFACFADTLPRTLPLQHTHTLTCFCKMQVVKLACGGGFQNNSDDAILAGVASYAYAVLTRSDSRTSTSPFRTMVPEWDPNDAPDEGPTFSAARLLYHHIGDGTYNNVGQLLPCPVDWTAWSAETLTCQTFTGDLRIGRRLVSAGASGAAGTVQAEQESPDGGCCSNTALVGNHRPEDTSNSAQSVLEEVALVSAPAAAFMMKSVRGMHFSVCHYRF